MRNFAKLKFLLFSCYLWIACSNEREGLREWTPNDHVQPPSHEIDPSRVPKQVQSEVNVGELLWMKNCAQCHGIQGQGSSQVSLDLQQASWQQKTADADIASVIVKGKPPMPAFAAVLSESQIAELVKYVRTLSNQAINGALRNQP